MVHERTLPVNSGSGPLENSGAVLCIVKENGEQIRSAVQNRAIPAWNNKNTWRYEKCAIVFSGSAPCFILHAVFAATAFLRKAATRDFISSPAEATLKYTFPAASKRAPLARQRRIGSFTFFKQNGIRFFGKGQIWAGFFSFRRGLFWSVLNDIDLKVFARICCDQF